MRRVFGKFFSTRVYLVTFLSIAALVVSGIVVWGTSARSGGPPTLDEGTAQRVVAARQAKWKEDNDGDRVDGDRVEGDDDDLPFDVRDSPPDTTPYARPLIRADRIRLPKAPASVNSVVIDTVVNNGNANLKNTDTAGDGETNIAINPANPNEIVITAFSSGWGANSALWHSFDGGQNWTENFTIPVPPSTGNNGSSGCPCDQSIDYGRSSRMAGALLTVTPTDVYTGITTDPTLSSSWNWLVTAGNAQKTNSSGAGNVDQPWLMVNRDPSTASQDNVYVAYDDFSQNPVNMHVATSAGANPPSFSADQSTGQSGGSVNPGHRLAVDPNSGAVYSLYQESTGGDNNARTIKYHLNRSTDGGSTWTLNGDSSGIVVATADSTQPYNKFGTVNSLLGGVDHATVDPTNGDVYYVYGTRNSSTQRNRIAIRRLTDDGAGGLNVGSEVLVTGELSGSVQSALPSVAVNSDGAVGVFYYTYDGMTSGFPQFTTHFAASTDHGQTFSTNLTLSTFLSPVNDDGQGSTTRQRVLGDYQEMKAVGKTFFGSFTGNGAAFGRSTSNMDPIFFKIGLSQASTTTSVTASPASPVTGQPVTFTATVSSSSTPTGTVSFSDGPNPIGSCQNLPLVGGQVQCQNIPFFTAGNHTITANYNGDVAFTGSSDSIAENIGAASTVATITNDAPDPTVFGQNYIVTASVAVVAPGAGIPTGTITVTDGTNSCTITLPGSTCTMPSTSPGLKTLTAKYNGSSNYLASPNSAPAFHLVNKADTVTTVTSAPNPSIFGQPVTFTATVAAKPPGAGTPTGTVNFNVDGIIYCPNSAINGSGVATCTVSGFPSLGVALSPHAVVVTYSGDANFNGSLGSLPGGQVVTKAATVTTITNAAALGTSTLVNQGYPVNWSTTVTAPGAGTPTGNVTVSDGAASCTAAVAAGTCTLTSTTIGNPKTITAVYAGDANFTGSTSTGVTHVVNLQISGFVSQYNGANPATPLGGATVTLSGCTGGPSLTQVSAAGTGAYAFTGQFTGTCVVSASGLGKLYDPITRTYSTVSDNVSAANFTAYNSLADDPRKLRVPIVYGSPGQAITVPVMLDAQGNEASAAFSLTYDVDPFVAPPTVACGSDAVNCTLSTTPGTGVVGITITPNGGGVFTSGTKQIATLKFQALATTLSNTPINVTASPTNVAIRDIASNPLLTQTLNGFVVFQQGLEGDVAGQHAGDAQILANDVTIERNLVAGTSTADPTFNEFQRADAAPKGTLGDGVLNAADVVQVRRFVLGLDTPTAAGGPFTGNPGGPIAPEDTNDRATPAARALKVSSTNAVAGSKVSVDVTLDAAGNEAAASFDVGFDAMKLTNPTVTLGSGAPADTTLTVNTESANTGRIRVLIDSSNSFEKADAKQVVTITFDVAGSAPTGDTEVSLSNGSLSDTEATDIPVSYTSGKVTINGNSPGVTLSGRVVTPEGAGLRAAIVTLTDSKGSQRVVTTSSLGFYSFDATLPGEYTISVTSKRYRFQSRTVQAADNLADLDFVGAE